MLFNLYLEQIFAIALQNEKIGIKINGKVISNQRYADDSAILESFNELQQLMAKINNTGQKFEVKLSAAETKLIYIVRGGTPGNKFYIDGELVEEVEKLNTLDQSSTTNLTMTKILR